MDNINNDLSEREVGLSGQPGKLRLHIRNFDLHIKVGNDAEEEKGAGQRHDPRDVVMQKLGEILETHERFLFV